MASEDKIFEYIFNLPNGEVYQYPIIVDDSGKLVLKNELDRETKELTRLEYSKCSNCPLKGSECTYCPAASVVMDIISHFKDLDSFAQCHVEVIEKKRRVSTDTDIQSALRSLLGLVLPLSGCPHLTFLKSMALNHLPFSTSRETLVRVMGFHLLGEYLENPERLTKISRLEKLYNELNDVNQGLLGRVSKFEHRDAGKNAFVVLDSFLQIFNCEVEFNFDDIKKSLE
ncbi:MAG: hypothetical protein BM556_01260 [Bacteriovorax sp. MedPE-SWde]|nr:MAG: hypothetical protein BM556_01260 [Bacteriovorax sp. MedPE-SWde]